MLIQSLFLKVSYFWKIKLSVTKMFSFFSRNGVKTETMQVFPFIFLLNIFLLIKETTFLLLNVIYRRSA